MLNAKSSKNALQVSQAPLIKPHTDYSYVGLIYCADYKVDYSGYLLIVGPKFGMLYIPMAISLPIEVM